MKKKEVIEMRESLLEMFKAGFLDGYRNKNKLRSKKDFEILNKSYKLAFAKRFEKKIDKELKKMEKKEKKK